jgi:hypothetical protein
MLLVLRYRGIAAICYFGNPFYVILMHFSLSYVHNIISLNELYIQHLTTLDFFFILPSVVSSSETQTHYPHAYAAKRSRSPMSAFQAPTMELSKKIRSPIDEVPR